MSQIFSPEEVYQEVIAGTKYRNLMPAFIRRVCEQECAKGRSRKESIKAVRGKLHQAGAAYQEQGIPYKRLVQQMENLGPEPPAQNWKTFGLEAMACHASTSERLPIVEDFFHITTAEIAPIHSVLDLACGLNPLAFPFMPLAEGAEYLAGDIYLDMVDFLNLAFRKSPVDGRAFPLDLAVDTPQEPVHLAMLLKTLPCMEQQVKERGSRLLADLQAEHLLVSFPVHSLGGRSKGMSDHYAAYMDELLSGHTWRVKRFDFVTEQAFLISK